MSILFMSISLQWFSLSTSKYQQGLEKTLISSLRLSVDKYLTIAISLTDSH